MAQEKTLRVKLVKSTIGQKADQVKTVHALGLKKIGDVREHRETDAIRGMIFKVKHLIVVEEM